MPSIKIAVADDQNLFRESLCALIGTMPDFDLVLETVHGESFLTHLPSLRQLPDIALIDLQMPVMDGLELTKKLHLNYPSIRIIILSVHNDSILVGKLIEEGVHGYLEKNCDSRELASAIRSAYHNGFYMSKKIVDALHDNSKHLVKASGPYGSLPQSLSVKEKQVLRLICTERNTAEIASELHISPRTVEWHRKNLLQKTGSRNTAGLVLFSIRNGIYYV